MYWLFDSVLHGRVAPRIALINLLPLIFHWQSCAFFSLPILLASRGSWFILHTLVVFPINRQGSSFGEVSWLSVWVMKPVSLSFKSIIFSPPTPRSPSVPLNLFMAFTGKSRPCTLDGQHFFSLAS